MVESGTSILIVVLVIVGIVLFNIGLYVTIKSGKRKRNPTGFINIIKTVKDPFGEADKQLEELSRLMKDLKTSENNVKIDGSD
jgi:hypothetical protein